MNELFTILIVTVPQNNQYKIFRNVS